MTASARFNMSHMKVKLLKLGKRSDACLRRYHVVTAFYWGSWPSPVGGQWCPAPYL